MSGLIMKRRGFIGGALALMAAPSIVRIDSLMKIVPLEEETFLVYGKFIDKTFVSDEGPYEPGLVGVGRILKAGMQAAMAEGRIGSFNVMTDREILAARTEGIKVRKINEPPWPFEESNRVTNEPFRIQLPANYRKV